MRFGRLLLLTTLMGFVAAGNALADSTYQFSISGSGIGSTGVLTASLTGSAYTVSNITGNYDGSLITGLLPAGTYQANDNLLYPTQPLLDFSGISFSVGSLDYNLFYDNALSGCESVAGYYVFTAQSATSTACGPTVDTPVSFSVTATPEPPTGGLMLLGIGLVFVMRRRIPLGFPRAG
jgi:hypothetical protein